MNTLAKQVAKVAQTAKNRDTKQVINDLMQMLCNLLTEPLFIDKAFPLTLYTYDNNFRQELTYYKTDLKAWAELQTLANMFMEAIKAGEPFTDHVGSLYDLELAGNKLGQFLTPPDLADTLGELLISIAPTIDSPITIGDPAGCGAGTLVLSLIKALHKAQGAKAVKFLNVRAIDLDINMVKMTAVQVVLNSAIRRIPLGSFVVQCGNTITDYTAMNEGKRIAFAWQPNTPLLNYIDATRGSKKHHLTTEQLIDKTLETLEQKETA